MAQQLRGLVLAEDLDWVATTLMATQPSLHPVTGHLFSDPKGTRHTQYTYLHTGKTLIDKYISKIWEKK